VKMVEPRDFYAPEAIYQEVSEQLQKAHSSDELVDYLTFVPDGEPTLDINLGRAIDLLREFENRSTAHMKRCAWMTSWMAFATSPGISMVSWLRRRC